MIAGFNSTTLASAVCLFLFAICESTVAAVQDDDAAASSSVDGKLNIILMIVDDVSAEDLGCYGNAAIHTPNLNRLANEGVVFDNAYLSISSCSPSRCSIISGRYPHNTGAPELHTRLPADQFRFPALLSEHRYYTLRSGKHHGENSDPAFQVTDAGRGPGKMSSWVQLLRDRPRDQPFFFWLASTDAHRGWSRSEEIPIYDPEDVVVPPYLVDGPVTRQDLADYWHEVSRIDHMVGQLLDEIERQGIADQTVFIFCADNGRPFPRCKTFLFDDGIKTPLIFWSPGRIDTARTQSLVSAIDLAPTILDLAGVPCDARVQGVSFTSILDDPQVSTRDYVFAEHNWHVFQNHERMVRHGRFVYIRNTYPHRRVLCSESTATFPAGVELWEAFDADKLTTAQRTLFDLPQPDEQLYDVESDPDQLANLVDSPEHQVVLNESRQLLDRWIRETGDSVPSDPSTDRYRSPRYREGAPADNPDFKVGEFPGAANNATSINHPGPIRR